MSNLRDRLKRIQELKKIEVPQAVHCLSDDVPSLTDCGWETCGFKTLKREITVDAHFELQTSLPPALAIVVPDLAGRSSPGRSSPGRNLPGRTPPRYEDFLFFDLETTGLSGGAGTVAFLAAFGRMLPVGKLHITQYLLLDYPGQNDFLEAVLKEFKDEQSVIVSYNGKCFDSSVLKTMCLVNRIRPPDYFHADLLHPARRLWKNVIADCSQGSVETRILGLDRGGDTPGALAPDIWFDFLKTGGTERLLGICDHNCADIAGLASILAAMISIAADPFGSRYRYDVERLSLYWRDFLRRHTGESINDTQYGDLRITGNKLLRFAAEKNYPYAAFVYALDHLRSGDFEEGRKRLLDITASVFPKNIKASAFRSLAIDSERRLKCFEGALEFVKSGLELEAGAFWKNEFEHRKERLEKKLRPDN